MSKSTVPVRWGEDGPVIGRATMTYREEDLVKVVMEIDRSDAIDALARGTLDAVSIAPTFDPGNWREQS